MIPHYDEIEATFEDDVSTLLVAVCNGIFQLYKLDYIFTVISQLPAGEPSTEI